MEQQAVEVEVVVPCVEGQQHPIRLRIHSWGEWEVAYTPCEALLGRAFGLMAPCSHYVRQNRNQLKRAVVEQLALAGAPAVPALCKALEDGYRNLNGNYPVRRAAAEALGQIGDASAVPALIQALGDENWDVCCAAAWALGAIGNPQAVPALRVHAELLEEAQQALQQFEAADFSLTQAVQTLAQQAQWQVLMRALRAKSVCQAIVSLGTAAVPALIEALGDGDWEVRLAATEALGAIGDASAVPALIGALGNGDWYVRCVAAEVLGEIGDASAVPALKQALSDPYYDEWNRRYPVREAAKQALEKIRARQSSNDKP